MDQLEEVVDDPGPNLDAGLLLRVGTRFREGPDNRSAEVEVHVLQHHAPVLEHPAQLSLQVGVRARASVDAGLRLLALALLPRWGRVGAKNASD